VISIVDAGLEDLYFLTSDRCAPEAADQLVGLAAKHRTRNNF
jgi:hypothetical protein